MSHNQKLRKRMIRYRKANGQPAATCAAWLAVRRTKRKKTPHDYTQLEEIVTQRTAALSTANRQLQAASKVSTIAITILEPENLVRQVVNLIQEQFNFYYVGLFLADRNRQYAVLHAGTGPAGAAMLRAQHKLPIADNSMIGWCINHAQARIALDVELESTRFANPYLPETRSEMALPLITRGQTIGALTVQSTQNAAFSEQDIAVLQSMSDHVATAITNARLYEATNTELAERKRIEQEREALIRELETKNAELERFTYTVSHDLKSPLITIKGFLGFLERDAVKNDQERLKSDINHITYAVDTMQKHLKDLLDLSQIGQRRNRPEPVPLVDVIDDAVSLVSARLTARHVHLEVAPDLPIVVADRSRLREVFENLLSNAAKFMGDQPYPHIEIGARQDDQETIFYVRDNGIGIEAQYQELVFGLFEKLDPTVEGSGIGLALVKRIIETHGGRIWVDSEGHGRGSTFYFTLPAAK